MSNYLPIQPAKIEWQPAPKSIEYGDVYFASADFASAITESEQVFLAPNNLPARFLPTQDFAIGETGFGSGLNFLVAVNHWLKSNRHDCLYFYSVEKHPWQIKDLEKLYQNHPLQKLADQLLANYPQLLPGWHRLVLFNGRVELRLFFGEALQGFNDLDLKFNPIQAWLLDGFAPSKNPNMWSLALFKMLRKHSQIGTTLASFSVASQVRKNLLEAGFATEKIAGFGNKREMLVGKVEQNRNFGEKFPWFALAKPTLTRPASKPEVFDLAVVGAGLAGAAVAQVFAKQGYKVLVLEQATKPAASASGNLAGILHLPISADWNLRSQWYFQGLQASWRYLHPWLQAGKIRGELDGLLQLIKDSAEQQPAFANLNLDPTWASWLSAEQASELAGGELSQDAIFYQQAGWVEPTSVVAACLDNPNISVKTEYQIAGILFNDQLQAWQLRSKFEQQHAINVVFATGAHPETHYVGDLKIRPLRGQISYLNPDNQAWLLQKPLLHQGYSSPAAEGFAVTGASYDDQNLDLALRAEDQAQNLAWAQAAVPDWLHNLADLSLTGRASVRAATKDHLPLVGAVSDTDWLQDNYCNQPAGKSPFQYPIVKYINGLYISNGHGSRGLTSVFLAAEILLAQITGKPLPIQVSLYNSSLPARFIIRNWKQSQASASLNSNNPDN